MKIRIKKDRIATPEEIKDGVKHALDDFGDDLAELAKPLPVNYQPTKEFLDSVWGNITKHGIKIMADNRQWVLHCLTGEALPREECEPFKNKSGNVMWKRKGEVLSMLDELKHFIWKNPPQSTF